MTVCSTGSAGVLSSAVFSSASWISAGVSVSETFSSVLTFLREGSFFEVSATFFRVSFLGAFASFFMVSRSILPTICRSMADGVISVSFFFSSAGSFISAFLAFSFLTGAGGISAGGCFSFVPSVAAGFSTLGLEVFSRSILPTSFISGLRISVFISTVFLLL